MTGDFEHFAVIVDVYIYSSISILGCIMNSDFMSGSYFNIKRNSCGNYNGFSQRETEERGRRETEERERGGREIERGERDRKREKGGAEQNKPNKQTERQNDRMTVRQRNT